MAFELPVDQPFDLELTLKCGQGHRWLQEKDVKGIPTGWWNSVLCDDLVRIKQMGGVGGSLQFQSNAPEATITDRLRWQFRMKSDDKDITTVYGYLRRDPQMARLVNLYMGLRVMRVDLWEGLVFFILTAQRKIEWTQQRMEDIANKFQSGKMSATGRYPFPLPTDIPNLATVVPPELVELPLGLDKDIKVCIAGLYHMNHAFDLLGEETSLEQVIRELQDPLWGVGDKTANCVALFSIEKLDAFPVDTHIYAGLECLYGTKDGFPKQRDPSRPNAKQVREWVEMERLFGPYAGYASQFLFADNYPETRRP